ncbi:MAG: outer membrane protein [Nitrospirales bacterium]
MCTPRIIIVAMVVVFAFCLGVSIHQVNAEMYIGGQAGVNFPKDLKDVRGTNSFSGTRLSDLEVKDSLAVGLKVGGYFPDSLNWLGLEGEAYYTSPTIKRQTVTGNVAILGNSGGQFTIPETDLHIVTLAFNALVRYPDEILQPYGGVGIGLNIGYLRSGNVSSDAGFAPSLNLLGGLRAFVAEKVAMFAEYKYSRGTFEFYANNFKADYRTNMIVGGLTFHFR